MSKYDVFDPGSKADRFIFFAILFFIAVLTLWMFILFIYDPYNTAKAQNLVLSLTAWVMAFKTGVFIDNYRLKHNK